MSARRIARVEVKNPKFKAEEKRFYMPGHRVVVACRSCKREVTLDLKEHPLNYPVFNQPFTQTIWCEDCDAETDVKLHLKLELVLASPE